jgi:hypothetical protein
MISVACLLQLSMGNFRMISVLWLDKFRSVNFGTVCFVWFALWSGSGEIAKILYNVAWQKEAAVQRIERGDTGEGGTCEKKTENTIFQSLKYVYLPKTENQIKRRSCEIIWKVLISRSWSRSARGPCDKILWRYRWTPCMIFSRSFKKDLVEILVKSCRGPCEKILWRSYCSDML